MSWIVSVPVWGAAYLSTFVRVTAPALVVAARRLRQPVRFVLHTDGGGTVAAAALQEFPVECRPVSSRPTYVTLQESHADALAQAEVGDRVVLLNADLVVSGNFLLRCREHLDVGRLAVVLMGIRTVATDQHPPSPEAPPIGAAPRDLLAWAWDHRHQIIRDLEWPHGGSLLPTNLFFAAGDSVVARGFHLHPAAVVRQEGTSFSSTIDGDLLDAYPRDRIHVVTSPDDCAMLEVSDAGRSFPKRDQHLTPALVAASMQSRASPMHRWLFTHRIVVRGTGREVADDADVVRQTLEVLERGTPGGRQPRRPQRGGPPSRARTQRPAREPVGVGAPSPTGRVIDPPRRG